MQYVYSFIYHHNKRQTNFLLLRLEIQHIAIHAVALAGRCRAVVEYMAKVRAAALALYFYPIAIGIGYHFYTILIGRLVKAGPAGMAIELGT